MIVGTTNGSILFSTLGTTNATMDQLLPRMAITSTGNVGIGTTSPNSKLHIYESTGTS